MAKGMSKTGIPYADYAWNPAPGCTNGCEGCWARRFAQRNQHCELCREFVPHLHPERLEQPANTKKPGVVVVNFMGELFDPARDMGSIHRVLDAAADAPQHAYLWLTQQPARMLAAVEGMDPARWTNWHFGVTVRTQHEFSAAIDARLWWPGPIWLSMEPMLNWVTLSTLLRPERVSGVVVGCDRRATTPCDIEWVCSIVEQCCEAKVPVYVKQLNIDGKVETAMEKFPVGLRIRQLPWGDNLQERANA